MNLQWKLKSINAQFSSQGVTVTYGVEFHDGTIGFIGSKGYTVTSPEYLALIQQAAAGAVPLMTAQIGMPGGLPEAPADPPPVPGPLPPVEGPEA